MSRTTYSYYVHAFMKMRTARRPPPATVWPGRVRLGLLSLSPYFLLLLLPPSSLDSLRLGTAVRGGRVAGGRRTGELVGEARVEGYRAGGGRSAGEFIISRFLYRVESPTASEEEECECVMEGGVGGRG